MTKKRNKNYIEIEQRFINSLIDLLFEKGYGEISVNEIIEKSGVKSKKTFYLHFKDKDEIFLKVQNKVADDIIEYYKTNSHPTYYFTNREKFYKFLSNTVKKNLSLVTCVSNSPFAVDFVKLISDKIVSHYKSIYSVGEWKDCHAPAELFNFYHTIVSGIVFDYMAEIKAGMTLNFNKIEEAAIAYRKMDDAYCLEYYKKLNDEGKKFFLPNTYVEYMLSIYPDSKDIWKDHIHQVKK